MRKGSLLIMVILILFVVLLFITASILAVHGLNNLQKNENIEIKEQNAIRSLINEFNELSMFGDIRGNIRGDISININNEIANGNIKYKSFNNNDKKYLILESKIINNKGKAINNKISYKQVPEFTYTHLVMNPEEELGNEKVLEKCNGIIRANKENNSFKNIIGNVVKESGGMNVYMQDIDVNDYSYLAKKDKLYLENNSDISLFFNDNNKVFIYPLYKELEINKDCIIAIKNHGHKVRLIGNNENNLYIDIKTSNYITFVTDSPIYIESNILGDFMFISTFKDTDTEAAFNFDINNYIDHVLKSEEVMNNKINYDEIDMLEINFIHLGSVFIATQGSFGFLKNTYVSNGYNPEIMDQYEIVGSLIEYNSNYKLKNFNTNDGINPQLIIDFDKRLIGDDQFLFKSPPVAKDILTFDMKYF